MKYTTLTHCYHHKDPISTAMNMTLPPITSGGGEGAVERGNAMLVFWRGRWMLVLWLDCCKIVMNVGARARVEAYVLWYIRYTLKLKLKSLT